jgi:hypothetical protein
LVITLGAVGLSAFTSYLDYVFWPALGIMIFTSLRIRDGRKPAKAVNDSSVLKIGQDYAERGK